MLVEWPPYGILVVNDVSFMRWETRRRPGVRVIVGCLALTRVLAGWRIFHRGARRKVGIQCGLVGWRQEGIRAVNDVSLMWRETRRSPAVRMIVGCLALKRVGVGWRIFHVQPEQGVIMDVCALVVRAALRRTRRAFGLAFFRWRPSSGFARLCKFRRAVVYRIQDHFAVLYGAIHSGAMSGNKFVCHGHSPCFAYERRESELLHAQGYGIVGAS